MKKEQHNQARTFSIQRLANTTLVLTIVLAVLYLGASFFIPIVYGIFFAFMLKPICDRYERKVKNRVTAIVLTLITVFLVLGGIATFFVVEITSVMSELDGVVAQLQDALEAIVVAGGDLVGLDQREAMALLRENLGTTSIGSGSIRVITTGLSTGGSILATFSLILIYTFFFLLYSTSLKRFFMGQFRTSAKMAGAETIHEIQGVATSYLGGMLTVMLILGVLNTFGLWMIGIRFAPVWGFLGALLAVVPYVGTFVGGLLPFLYAIATTDTTWQPLAVVALYVTVQSIEGNLITPKVVGNSVKINALAAVVSLIFGAFFWGIAGVILAIPLLAMIRVVLDHIDTTKPLALLLSDELYDKSELFITDYNRPKYRLSNMFRGTKVLAVQQVEKLLDKKVEEVREADAEVIAHAKAQEAYGDAGGQ